MNIRSIRVYQAVTFEKSASNNFTTDFIPGKPAIELNYLKDVNAVEIKSPKDHVIVPITNISAIHVKTKTSDEEQEVKKAERSGTKSGVRASEIKRPK